MLRESVRQRVCRYLCEIPNSLDLFISYSPIFLECKSKKREKENRSIRKHIVEKVMISQHLCPRFLTIFKKTGNNYAWFIKKTNSPKNAAFVCFLLRALSSGPLSSKNRNKHLKCDATCISLVRVSLFLFHSVRFVLATKINSQNVHTRQQNVCAWRNLVCTQYTLQQSQKFADKHTLVFLPQTESNLTYTETALSQLLF